MKHHLIQRLEDNLKGCEFQMSNNGITHWIYPCQRCGNIMYHLFQDEDQILAIELNNVESLDIARQMWNRVSGLKPMSKRIFVEFLRFLAKTNKEIAEKENNEN